MTGRQKRLLLLAVPALLAVWTLGLVAMAVRDDGAEPGVATSPAPAPAATIHGDDSPFRAGSLPEGIGGARAPRFALDDARGGRVSTASLEGRPYLVTFLYVECKDVCPLIGQEIKQALERLGPRGREVTAIAISADPHTDTPQAVRAWLRKHRMPDNFRYLVGSRPELAPVWESHYAAPQPHEKAESAHSASIWLVDRKGRWRAKFSGGAPVPPADIAHDLGILLDEPA